MPSDPLGQCRAVNAKLDAQLSFDYQGRIVPALEESRGFYDAGERVCCASRSPDAEQAARNLLSEIGVRFRAGELAATAAGLDLAPARFAPVVTSAAGGGMARGGGRQGVPPSGRLRVDVPAGSTGSSCTARWITGETREAAGIAGALRRGDNMVRLGDGTFGLLPEEWLERFAPLAGLGTAEEDHLRFRRNQAGLLDALLAAQPEATSTRPSRACATKLRSFDGVEAAAQPAGFVGQLRDYQREGLGWMEFLRRISLRRLPGRRHGRRQDGAGAGAAGKPARIAARRHGPSLVVVPKSLMFNWKQEAARFTPQLRVLDHTGLAPRRRATSRRTIWS